MKQIFTQIKLLFLFIFLPGLLFAQAKNDFNILLKTGGFIPAENVTALSKNAHVFQKSLFLAKHYVTIQFNSLPDQAAKNNLAAAGIQLIDYIPNFAFTASVREGIDIASLQSFNIRSVFQLSADQKSEPALLSGMVPPHAIKQAGYADITVLTYEKLNRADVSAAFENAGAVVLGETAVFRTFTVRISSQNISKLADLAFVQWLEFIPPPNQPENLPGRTLHRASILNDGIRNLKGDGINVSIWDAGEISPHLDFSPTGRVVQVQTSSPADHSTHCAGTICGRGLINPFARGMAPNAKLYSYDYNGDVQAEMATAIPANNLIVSSHSYNDGLGVQCGLTGANSNYSLVSRNTDVNLNNNPSHLHVHSSGNNQTACSGGWTTITGAGKSAKNNMTVGALSSTEAMTTFSSFGPVADGRVKPEICAMGLNVFSTFTPLNTYSTISGTSMSTPGAAGTVTLLVQAYKQLNGGNLPPSSLIRNVVCNGAKDLGNVGPDYKYGYGCINALQAVKILEQNRYIVNTMSTGGIDNNTITVPAGTARLRVMLTWNDPAATANANPALVNNLDLTVSNGTTTLPWILDKNNPATPATRGVDNISNIEQVTIDNPAAGTYTLSVAGTAIPMGPQQYSLTWTIDQPGIEVVYPNGAESFNPGISELITWDNAGITGNQTVEYSLNNGTSWTTISSTVPATTNRLAWTIPTANTSTALIRVSSGALTDVSDANFKILGTTTGFAAASVAGCNSGEVSFVWNAVTNATHYDIYKLDNTTGTFVILAADLTGTSYTATGLTPGASMWFTIIAKNNTTGAASGRSIAINTTVSSGGGGLGAVGTINGQTAVCGAVSNISYNIAAVTGATTYTWTAPPGASIVSGQGTTTITVNYLAGSSNGNIAVFAGNGVCQTNTQTLAITVNSASITAPASGGDQSQTVCPGAGLPSLTATATVPAGYTITWYNAATGGSAVANPVLSTVGTVTYYAASINTVSGCEGSTRTAVVLTISSVASASATAAGTTTFCQGASVLITAGAGSSYVWNKDGLPISGAVSQTYTANSSGSYTVTVTTGTCTSTSSPIVVTVNSLPTASATAGGATDLCQGDQVVLTASAGSSWLWSNGATTQSITVNTSGNYSVTVTNASSCSAASSAIAVTVSPNPVVSITASPYIKLYPGLITTLTANVTPSGTYTYTWFKNAVVVPGANAAILPGIDLDDLGSYTVTVTNASGLPCSNTSAALEISDSASTRMFIYPSPNSGQFKVSYYSPGTNVQNTLTIYDSKGALVYKSSYTLSSPYQTMNVDMRRCGKGVYQVVLFDKTGKKLAHGAVVLQ